MSEATGEPDTGDDVPPVIASTTLDLERSRTKPGAPTGAPFVVGRRTGGLLLAMVAVVAALLVAVFVWGLRQAARDNERLAVARTADPQTLTVLAGQTDPNGPTREYLAFYPAAIKAHAGDSVTFANPTPDVPHSIAFGVNADRSNQPVFGSGAGGPIDVVIRPCASDKVLTVASRTCSVATSDLPTFENQAFFSTGIVGEGQRVTIKLAEELPAGDYQYYCLLHSAQQGTITVEPHGVATQTQDAVAANARREQARDRAILKGLQAPQQVLPNTVIAGVQQNHANLNKFFPSEMSVNSNTLVTWQNDTANPHVVEFGDYVPPEVVSFAHPTLASGSDYDGRTSLVSGAIGPPPYSSRSYSLRFTTPGSYRYTCVLHRGMVGAIVVH